MNLRQAIRLYVATDRAQAGNRGLCGLVAAALRGGATAVQLRDKDATARQTLALGEQLRTLTRAAGALFIVNDRPDLALALDADGVHLGQGDLPLVIARRILGPRAVIGVSTNLPEEARRAEEEGADYVAIGPAFPTATKPDHRSVLGPERSALVRAVTNLPLVAIGGITAARVPTLRQAGVDGICVIGAVLGADSPEAAARALRAAYESV